MTLWKAKFFELIWVNCICSHLWKNDTDSISFQQNATHFFFQNQMSTLVVEYLIFLYSLILFKLNRLFTCLIPLCLCFAIIFEKLFYLNCLSVEIFFKVRIKFERMHWSEYFSNLKQTLPCSILFFFLLKLYKEHLHKPRTMKVFSSKSATKKM